ncbi:protocadherin-9-like [Physella acuta]|uniref:protocadherin-9-like n=1 Tax=Physella acuta TaxID=109671 RepID=UPI0027DAD0DD|nr:protocadherin-9-like [Physella acuta]
MISGTNVGSIMTKANIAQKVSSRELSKLSFKFLSQNNLLQIASLFSINSDNGAIYTTAMIDRESVCQFQKDCNIEFEVTVTSTISNFFEFINVRIIIEDINDNAPRFPHDNITLYVPEGGTANSEYRIDGATDKDKGEQNSVTSYEMKSDYNDMFELRSEMKLDGTWDLSIVILKILDREVKDRYMLYIIAKDSGTPQRSGNVTVLINVTDINDNVPSFSENVYEFSVSEEARVGSVVGTVTATDADLGDNAEITYELNPGKTPQVDALFYIDSQSGDIMVKKSLQYDGGKTFETIVMAEDRGNPRLRSQKILILKILDVGNTPPLMTINPVPNPDGNILHLSEKSDLETVVAHVRTEDRDEGSNGIVDCYSSTSQFRVKRLDGVGYLVLLNEKLDRERNEQVNVTIICEDRGTPKLSARGWFIIKLIDDNDNNPVFELNIYRANLTENNRRGQHVLFVKAHDADVGVNAEVRYNLSMGAAFNIDEITGAITAGVEFDRETISQMSFMVTARDGGGRVGNASVIVDIGDVNDNVPYFTSSLEFEIAEKLPASTMVDTLFANDRDEGRNAEVFFYVPTDSSDKQDIPFVVLPSGDIRTSRKLNKDSQDSYWFPVVVKDKGEPPRSSTATVTIRVVDYNDHRPVFIFPSRHNNTIRLRSDILPGTAVVKLSAVDEDIGANAKLKFFIVAGNDDNAFAIPSPSSGEIILRKELTTLASSVFRLNVSVHDQGIPMLSAEQLLVIQVDYVDGHGMTRSRQSNGGNSTNMFGDDDLKYIIIAGVVGGVTVVISIIIVTIILRLRRPDNNNRTSGLTGVQEQGDGRHFDKQMWQSVPVDDVTPTESDGKKMSGMTLKGGGLGLDTKPTNGDLHSSSDLIDTYGRKQGPEPFQGQPQLYTFKKSALRPPTDDHHSDTSGETTTSDSGRGGSEEDIQLPPLPELSEDTSRIIFKNPGAGLKDSRFVRSDYPDYGDREVIAFETFSPRTLPGSTDRRDRPGYGGRDVQTIGHAGRPITDKLRQNRQNFSYSPQPLSQTSPSHLSQKPPLKGNEHYWSTPSGPGHYPEDIPERGDPTLGKKVTFQPGLTTQNLKTWELTQKMNLPPDSTFRGAAGFHGNGSNPKTCRPKSQDDDDNTTTSGSYTINPENDFEETLPVPSYTMA